MRFLFHTINRQGLGHLMRARNIAREIRKLEPSAEVLLSGNPKSLTALWNDFEYASDVSLKEVRKFHADVVIFDTVFPDWTANEGHAQTVYIMRKIKERRRHHFLNHPLLTGVRLILIPHDPAEFSCELPLPLQQKCFFVGPIARGVDSNQQVSLREKYKIGKGDFVVTSTVGGGGFRDSASFFELVGAIHKPLYAAVRNLRHIVVLGPYCSVPVAMQEGMEIVRFEPEMPTLFALSNLVLAEAGYNTVNEIRLAKAPAIFFPARRKFDDQEERARGLEKRGLCHVFTQKAAQSSVQEILEICLSGSSLDQMKTNYSHDHVDTGNLAAARKILELVHSR